MTVNRGYNLVGTAIVAISGFAFFPEFFFRKLSVFARKQLSAYNSSHHHCH